MAHLRELKRLQWLSPEQTKALQEERLSRLLLHAYQRVPYYRNILQGCGIVRNDSIDLGKFKDIPFLSKSEIRENFESMKSDDLSQRQWFRNTSGGSTGEPAVFIQDREYRESSTAVKMLFDDWTGYRPGSPRISLWGSEQDLLKARKTVKMRMMRRLQSGRGLNAYCMTPENMRNYIAEINAFKPSLILAYAESIYELAKFIEREDRQVFSPKAIMTTAGTLSPEMRRLIEKVFACPVFNRYGSREVGDIACETEKHEGLMVSALTHYVEIVREDGTAAGPGEAGEVVVTLLTNHAMPLIRYRIGDMAAWSDHAPICGRGWPLLKEVTGRVTDNFISKDGAITHGAYFRHLLFYKTEIEKYQIIQEEYEKVRILLVLREKCREEETRLSNELSDIPEKIKLVLGKECDVEVKFVSDIASAPSGKHLYTISRVRRQG